jgi:hypothetical protein
MSHCHALVSQFNRWKPTEAILTEVMLIAYITLLKHRTWSDQVRLCAIEVIYETSAY